MYKQQQVLSCVSMCEGVKALGYVDTAEMEKCLFMDGSRHAALQHQLFDSNTSSHDLKMTFLITNRTSICVLLSHIKV